MREILFRAKRMRDKIWVKGSLLVLDADSGYYFITQPYKSASTLPVKDLIYNHTHLVDPKTVCQYTGRTDKNGKKVFEGDIVKDNLLNVKLLSDSRKKPRSGISVVRFGEHEVPSDDPFEWGFAYGFYFEGETLYPTPAAYDCPMHEDILTFEVIGNIFDNPELMKGGAE